MARRLKMAEINAIEGLLLKGWSHRKIAKAVGVDRETVSRYSKLMAERSNAAISMTGVETNPAISLTGSGDSNPAISVTGKWSHKQGRKSECEPYREVIERKVTEGLTAQRVFQDLKDEEGFIGSYSSVQRFIKNFEGKSGELPFRRMEVLPGKEAQVDFGSGYWVVENGKKRKVHIFRIILSHSRKGYSEGVFHQDTETFLRCLENAFYAFGGVPETLVPDNLKAAVTKADWYDPELNPKMAAFGRHYGMVILPCKPYRPEHKGKIESGIGYIKNNPLKGKTFESLAALNQYLREWEKRIADNRVHGTTKRQVSQVFHESEKKALHPLPEGRFPVYREGRRHVHRDGHVEVARSYYSVPPEYLGHQVWVQWDARLVRIYNNKLEEIAVHVKTLPGKFHTHSFHISDKKISGVERGAEYLLSKIARIGPQALSWAKAMMEKRGIEGVRVLQGLSFLGSRHSSSEINRACSIAENKGSFHLKSVRNLMEQDHYQEKFKWGNKHPIIRPMEEYSQFIVVNFNHKEREDHESGSQIESEKIETLRTSFNSGSPITGSLLESTLTPGIPGNACSG